jgi:hypothetical protein
VPVIVSWEGVGDAEADDDGADGDGDVEAHPAIRAREARATSRERMILGR